MRGLGLAGLLLFSACGGPRQLGGAPEVPNIAPDVDIVRPVLPGTPPIEADNGPYYHRRPQVASQPSATYFEGADGTPLDTYRQARQLWEGFEVAVSRLEPLGQSLQGWSVVLDPGHGGLDPGAIVQSRDGTGRTLYVVEDEYVFDIAMRVYILLRRHGATVTPTLLSPNHLIRRTNPPTRTFVHQKNEVYNSLDLNRTNTSREWPQRHNLASRVYIAGKAFEKASPRHRIFISFHADIDTKAPKAPLVLYHESRDGRQKDPASREFARVLQPALGAGTHIRGQPLGVLRNNPADYKVLVELRNMAYANHVWALRSEPLRQQDAEKVVKGLLDFVQRQDSGIQP